MQEIIYSIHGETGHLKNKHYLEQFISSSEKNRNQIGCIEYLRDNKVRNKLLEYDFCNLIIEMNLPVTNI